MSNRHRQGEIENSAGRRLHGYTNTVRDLCRSRFCISPSQQGEAVPVTSPWQDTAACLVMLLPLGSRGCVLSLVVLAGATTCWALPFVYKYLKGVCPRGWSQALLRSAKHQDKRQRAQTDLQEILPRYEEEFLYCLTTDWSRLPREMWSLPHRRTD